MLPGPGKRPETPASRLPSLDTGRAGKAQPDTLSEAEQGHQ